MSSQRAEFFHSAAHDLRDNMGVVLTATAALNKTEIAEVEDQMRAACRP